MSVFSGPGISQSGLVFAYDMGNTNKSWKGVPTTNINSGQGLGGMQTITLTYVGLENEWKKYSISGTWNAGTYPFSMYISGATFTGGIAYSAQCLMKTNVRNKFASFGFIYYVNDPNMTNGGTYTSTSIGYEDGLEVISNKVEGFIYSTGYANPTTSQVGYLGTKPLSDGTTFNSGTDFVWIKNVQVEQSTFCTPFTSTSRSSAQAILDWTGLNTINATSLTYNSNNTFSFNGTNSYVKFTKPSSIVVGGAISLSLWAKWTTTGTTTSTIQMLVDNNHSASPNQGFYLQDRPDLSKSLTFSVSPLLSTVQSTFQVGDGNWHHIVAINDLSMSKLYIDGNLNAETSQSGGIVATQANVSIGYWELGANRFLNGNIPQLSIYNRALSTAEVQQNFNALRGRFGI